MPTVLMVAYYFPPLAGGGVYRPLKFAKYFGQFGWQTVVLTVRNAPYHWASDKSLLEELPDDVGIERSRSFEPHRFFTALDMIHMRSVAAWIDRGIFVPDKQVGWIPSAVMQGLRIIKMNNIDMIVTTSPPHSSHYIGLLLKRWTGLPWIADFRDHWTLNPIAQTHCPRLEHRLERIILDSCDRVICATKGNRNEVLEHFPLAPDKVVTIYNGYDAEDFKDIAMAEHSDPQRLTIVYTGAFYGIHSPEPFFRGLRKALDLDPSLNDQIKVQFIGKAEEHMLNQIKQYDLEKVVQYLGFLPHREALSYQVAADVLLLLIPAESGNQNIMTGKVFEYMSTGKPILSLVPEGEAAEILRQAGVGTIVNPLDDAAIAQQLQSLVSRHRLGKLSLDPKWDVIRQFDRRELTGQLAGVMNEVKVSV